MPYIEVRFVESAEHINELLIALLSAEQFEGFEEKNRGLTAFISKELFDEATLADIAARVGVEYSVSELPDTNWNASWESNFQPVVVDEFCALRAAFHEPLKNVAHEIVITPKMSFGTGHHATTYMMIREMGNIDFGDKHVFDFGTGTGVLAILAAMLGAKSVIAVDNDDWSIDNAAENIRNNGIRAINLFKGDNADVNGVFDVILANITRNILVDNFSHFEAHTKPGSILLLSGLLADDEEYIAAAAAKHGFVFEGKSSRSNWLCMKYRR